MTAFSPARRKRPRSLPVADGGVALGEAIRQVIRTLERESPSWTTELAAEWPALAGAGAGAHTRPGGWRNGDLVVYVDNSVWLSELKRYGQRDLLAALQRRFGKERIRQVRLQLDPGR